MDAVKNPNAHVIGLIGGLGVGAAIHYYRELSAAHDRRSMPLQLSMVHAQMSRIFECASVGDRAGLARYLAGILQQLKAAGATLGVLPAVTPHLAIEELAVISPLPLVSMIDAVNGEIAERDLRRVALMGTRFVIETDLFGKVNGVAVIRPQPDEITLIHDTYTQLARDGAVSAQQRSRMVDVAGELCARGADAIVLAGTDLALLFDDTSTPFPHLDCAQAHIRAIMRAVAAG